MHAALAMATDLAAGVEEDAPAALLFAFASYRRAFPGAWRFMATSLALAQARRLGRTVVAPSGALEELLTRIMYREASFDDVRAWLEKHLNLR